MKKISKADQRKLYKMFEEIVDREASLSIQVDFDWGKRPNIDKILMEAKKKKTDFCALLEEGIRNF